MFSDDAWDAKLELLAASPVPIVSFTFGCPPHGTVTRFQKLGTEVWVTVTTVEEAIEAVSNGVDALVLQGVEAGGHRGSFTDDPADDVVDGLSLSVLLQLVLDTFDVPCVAAGGLMTGRAIASVLAAGALAAQLGTAFLLATEAGTPPIHREAVHWERPTAVTRAFTGRTARGIRNRFIDEHTAGAPAGVSRDPLRHLTVTGGRAGLGRRRCRQPVGGSGAPVGTGALGSGDHSQARGRAQSRDRASLSSLSGASGVPDRVRHRNKNDPPGSR